ncbi:MAG: hypothetical protein R3E14_11885 [Erythrobacter sp.]
MFLFAYHAARSLTSERLRSRLPLTPGDAKLLAENADAFAPLAAAFAPYLEAHPLFDDRMQAMQQALIDPSRAFPDPAMLNALEGFEPTYQRVFAPAHRTQTARFRERVENQIALHGPAMSSALGKRLERNWRSEPMRLFIVPYATWIGAYTSQESTVMGANVEDFWNHTLEMVYHEAAHTDPMTEGLKHAANAAQAPHGESGGRFWHYLQFYAVGRAAQEVLGAEYVPYHRAIGLSTREDTRPFYDAIDAVWDQYERLDSRAAAAVEIIIARMGRPSEG